MTEAEFDVLFEDEDFRKDLWVLIMLYLYVKEIGASKLFNVLKENFKEE